MATSSANPWAIAASNPPRYMPASTLIRSANPSTRRRTRCLDTWERQRTRANMAKTVEPWERLLTSHDLFADLCDLYDPEFYITFACRFDRNPHPVALVQGVHETAKAYLEAKWRKRAARSQLLKHSGVHLMAAGLAARRLSYALSQVGKSARASAIICSRYERQATERPMAQ